MKESGLRLRVNEALRGEFLRACRAQDRTAAQVLRDYMREYVERYKATAHQGDLFPREKQKR